MKKFPQHTRAGVILQCGDIWYTTGGKPYVYGGGDTFQEVGAVNHKQYKLISDSGRDEQVYRRHNGLDRARIILTKKQPA